MAQQFCGRCDSVKNQSEGSTLLNKHLDALASQFFCAIQRPFNERSTDSDV